MVLNKYVLAGMLAVNSLCLVGGVMAAVPERAAATETANDVRQDVELEKDQIRQDVADTVTDKRQDRDSDAADSRQDRNVEKNARAIEKNAENITTLQGLSGNQTFVLQLIGIFMPLLSLLATGLVAIQQVRAKNDRHAMAEETRSNLGQMGRSINGMKSELVAAVKAAAFAEGVAHASDTDLDTAHKLRQRATQLAEAAEEASKRADRLADEAVREIETKPPNGP